MLVAIISLVAICISYAFLDAWTGVAMNVVAIIRNIIFACDKNPDRKEITTKDWIILGFLMTAIIVLAVFTYDGFFSLFAVLLTMLYTISVWQKSTKVYRILGIFVSICGIIYDVFIGSYFALALESVVLIVNLIFLIKHYIVDKIKVEKTHGIG